MRHAEHWRVSAPVLALCAAIGAAPGPARAGGPEADTAHGAEPKSAQTVGQGGGDGISPTRRLEAEIEDYPVVPKVISDEKTRIPELIERRDTSADGQTEAAPQRGAGSAIDRSQVQRVFGRDVGVMAATSLDVAEVTRLQQLLRDRGHYLGRVDGIYGPQTRAALLAAAREQFTLAERLLLQGQMTSDLARSVGLNPAPEASDGAVNSPSP